MDRTIRILHVEDNPESRDRTRTFLEQEDSRFVVETVSSASQGLEKLSEESYDCVVSGYELSDINGIEFLETVRETDTELPFILFTGSGSEEAASDAFSAGASDYIRKEWTAEQLGVLATRIQNNVERTRVHRERSRQIHAIETAQEGISILDEDGYFVYVNDAFAELYGYDSEEMVGRHWELIYTDEDIPDIYEEILPTVKQEGFWRGETIGLRNDGSTFTESHTLARTEEGGLVCTVRDVSEQKRREAELEQQKERLEDEIDRRKAAEQRYRSLFENNPFVIWEHDFSAAKQYLDTLTETVADLGEYLETNPEELGDVFARVEVLDVNENAVDYYGATSKDHLLNNVEQVMADEAWSVTRDLWQSVAAGESGFRTETVAQTFDGERRYQILELYIPGADDGDYSRAYLTGTDITERKEREQTLTALHEAAQEIEQASDASVVYDTLIETAKQVLEFDLVVVDVERDGYLVQEAWKLEEEGDYWERTSLEEDDSYAIRAYNRQETILINDLKEVELTPADPEYRSALTVPIGKFGTFQAVFSEPNVFDDHDVEFGELLVEHARVKLTQLAGKEELMERTAELERQNERHDEFASFISHDLRNPLNVAQLRLDLVKEECESGHLADVDQALDRMEHLIADLLELTRHGRTVEETDPINLAEFGLECWETVQTDDATIECRTERTVYADEPQLASLFENLFSNAIEACGENATVTIGNLPDSTGIYVADDGSGIPKDQREDVFERGYTTKPEGTGLGLLIVRNVVQAHGWDISVTESEAGGARFEIRDMTLDEGDRSGDHQSVTQ